MGIWNQCWMACWDVCVPSPAQGSRSLLKQMWEAAASAQAAGLLPLRWRTWVEILAPNFSPVHPRHCGDLVSGLVDGSFFLLASIPSLFLNKSKFSSTKKEGL